MALDQGLSGPLLPASAYYMKHPPVQMRDVDALEEIERFLSDAVGQYRRSAYDRPAAQPVIGSTGLPETQARDKTV